MFYLVFEFRHSVSYCFIVFTAILLQYSIYPHHKHTHKHARTHAHAIHDSFQFQNFTCPHNFRIQINSCVHSIVWFRNKRRKNIFSNQTIQYASAQRNTSTKLLLIYFHYTYLHYYLYFSYFYYLLLFLCLSSKFFWRKKNPNSVYFRFINFYLCVSPFLFLI